METTKKQLRQNIAILIENGYTPKQINIESNSGKCITRFIKRAERFLNQIEENNINANIKLR